MISPRSLMLLAALKNPPEAYRDQSSRRSAREGVVARARSSRYGRQGVKRHGHRKQLHPFMGLLRCGRCGCSMPAERKKGKYVYYRCTGFNGKCGNTYVRQERLADLLGDVLTPRQLSPEVAEGIAVRSAPPTPTRNNAGAPASSSSWVISGVWSSTSLIAWYDDYVSGKISNEFWTRKSHQWGGRATDRRRRTGPAPAAAVGDGDSREDFRTRGTGRISPQIADPDRTAPPGRNSAIELHVRPRKSLSDLRFAVRPAGERERNRKLAEREGFEPEKRVFLTW